MAELRFRLNGMPAAIDPDKLMFAEARAIERATGKTLKEVMAELERGSIEALQALLWTARRRHEPGLKFSDLDESTFMDLELMPDEDDEPGEVPDGDGVDPTVAVPDGPAEPNL